MLKIIPPSGEPLSLPLPHTTTIAQVMAMVAERRKIDPAHYNLALPPEDPKVRGTCTSVSHWLCWSSIWCSPKALQCTGSDNEYRSHDAPPGPMGSITLGTTTWEVFIWQLCSSALIPHVSTVCIVYMHVYSMWCIDCSVFIAHSP